jgi:protein SCO1
MLIGCHRQQELPYYGTPEFTAEWAPVKHTIAPFSFVDQNGNTVSNETLRGKIHVANFFFTHCPSLCPKMTKTFKTIHDAVPDVELLSFSVDAENDTPDVLRAYAQKNDVRWKLLTGDQMQIYTLARTSYFAEKTIKKEMNEFLHTENMILVDGKGHIRGVYNATLPAEAVRIIADIKTLNATSSSVRP